MAATKTRSGWFDVDPAFLRWRHFPRLVVAAASLVATAELFALQGRDIEDTSWVAASAEVGQLLCDRVADDLESVERRADSGGD